MQHEFDYDFGIDFLSAGLRRQSLKRLGIRLALYSAFVVVVLVGVSGPDFATDAQSLGFLVVCIGAIVGLSYWHFRQTVRRIHKIWTAHSPSGRVKFVADDVALTLEFENSNARYKWADMVAVVRHPDVWIVKVTKNAFVFFPGADAPEEMKAFITEKAP